MQVSPARKAAFSVLMRVELDSAFSSEVLHSLPLMEEMDERDRALATEIALGCLRWQGELDSLLAASARRPLDQLDPEVRIALRMGCYQLRRLTRIPPQAAVSESVELVKQARKRSASGFVNAVLRRLPERPAPEKSCELAHPRWMVDRWRRIYGDRLLPLLRANLEPPPAYLRLNVQFPAEETLRRLAREGVETEPAGPPTCRLVKRGRPANTRSYREGRIHIQDISSQMIVPMLDLEASCSFLDLCAAPGGKTFQALELRDRSGGAVAADRHLHRLLSMRRLATLPVDMLVLDAEAPLPFRRRFDRILVDAPCSGTGTLARNPEIKWRLRPDDLEKLSRKQRKILRNALEVLEPGGVLVYATCSLEPEENQEVVHAVLHGGTEFEARAYLQRVPGQDPGDGFFACKIVRR